MPFSPVHCPACDQKLPLDFVKRPEPTPCPSCQKKIQLQVCPAAYRKSASPLLDAKKNEGESSCFYHPDKPAVAVCDFCGVFISDLCDLPINGKHICPPCFAKPANKTLLLQSDRSRALYDGIALGLTVLPFVGILILGPLIVFTFFTSLAAIFISIRYWKSPGSLIRRTKIRYILAILIATLQIIAWIALAGFLVNVLRPTS